MTSVVSLATKAAFKTVRQIILWVNIMRSISSMIIYDYLGAIITIITDNLEKDAMEIQHPKLKTVWMTQNPLNDAKSMASLSPGLGDTMVLDKKIWHCRRDQTLWKQLYTNGGDMLGQPNSTTTTWISKHFKTARSWWLHQWKHRWLFQKYCCT